MGVEKAAASSRHAWTAVGIGTRRRQHGKIPKGEHASSGNFGVDDHFISFVWLVDIPFPCLRLPLKFTAEGVAPGENGAGCCRYDYGVALLSVNGKTKFMEDAYRIFSSAKDGATRILISLAYTMGMEEGRLQILWPRGCIVMRWKWCGVDCDTKSDVEEAIKLGFLRIDREFLDLGLSSGACRVTALIRQEDEKPRIEEKGGFVEMHRGTWRVHGVLSISRSIGDSHLKQWITAESETRIIPLTPELEFLILASDGLWEQLSNQEAVYVVNRLYSTHKKTHEAEEEDGNGEEYGLVSMSPSSKLRCISLKQPAGCSSQSPSCRKLDHSRKDVEGDSLNEFDNPPVKMRRISMVKRLKTRTVQASKDDIRSDDGLVAACKELANLTVSRGSMDDITVMIIDLHHFQ
ncbi:hypothetical protein MLD38_017029 [Melastoma candidum]|uniref:Uncharacterized protein n=1 Tax=Melastoma candidum TaxID=119954 RepID=A0ACB9QPH1_9MYRT|nr:hypothetical protein MLD38_017029 [Melastoma candidum]